MAKAAELMKVVPSVVVPAAYVGLVNIGGETFVRSFSEDGSALADVAGPFTPVASGEVAFIRGATEGSIDGCAFAYLDGTDLYVIDLEALDLVVPATTHRPAEVDGLTWAVTMRAGSTGVFWECGVLAGTISYNPGTSQVGWLRRISRDGATIDSIEASIPNPFAGEQFGIEIIGAYSPIPINATTWALPFRNEENSESDHLWSLQTVNESGTLVEVADIHIGAESAGVGVVLGSSAGTPINRWVLDGTPFGTADESYVAEDLFDLTALTVQNAGTLRAAGGLVVLVAEGSDVNVQASRLCTYAGSHPITTSTEGPNFERDDGAGESLVVCFGL